MGGNFIKEQDRWLAAPLGDQFGVSKDQTEQKRLLLASR